MANALTQLGYNVHDFEEHLEYNLDNYINFFDGDLGEEMFLDMYGEERLMLLWTSRPALCGTFSTNSSSRPRSS